MRVLPAAVRALVLAQFLETASELDLAVRSTGADAVEYRQEEATARAVWTGGIEERMWAYLTRGDPEARRVARGKGR